MDKRMKMYVDLLKQSKDLDERLKKVKSSMAEIEPLVLEYFVDNGVDRITIEGVTLYPKSQIWASVPELALDDLRIAGHSDLIEEKVNSSRISALIREMVKEIPDRDIDKLPEWCKNMNISEKHSVGYRMN
jgi:hypothetical protein